MKKIVLVLLFSTSSAFAQSEQSFIQSLAPHLIAQKCQGYEKGETTEIQAQNVCSHDICFDYCAENYPQRFLKSFLMNYSKGNSLDLKSIHNDLSQPVKNSLVLSNVKTGRHYEIVSSGDSKYLMDYSIAKENDQYPDDAGCGVLVKVENGVCKKQESSPKILSLFSNVKCINKSGGPSSKLKRISNCSALAKAMSSCLNTPGKCITTLEERDRENDHAPKNTPVSPSTEAPGTAH